LGKYGYNREEAFTLIEVLVTIVVVSLSCLYFVNYFSDSITYTNQAEMRDQAIKLATNTIENIREDAVNDWSSLNLSDYDNSLIDTSYSLKTNFIINTVLDNTSDIDSDGTDDVMAITITVSWDSGNHQVALSTLVVER